LTIFGSSSSARREAMSPTGLAPVVFACLQLVLNLDEEN